ncbi:MAG: PEP-CTERM sorting domain-containing protein [Phycisphaeraceae bacterium]
MTRNNSRILIGIFGSLAIVSAASADSIWSGGYANWSSNGNPGWNGTGVPNAVDAVANTSAMTSALGVNGSYTLGTVLHYTTTNRPFNSGGAGTGLIFDVGSGNALIDLGSNPNNSQIWATNVTLNDNLELKYANPGTNAISMTLNGVVGGNGGFILNGSAGGNGSDLRLILSNPGNSFAGGVAINPQTSLWLNASGAAGTGTIDQSAATGPQSAISSIVFQTNDQTHSNNFILQQINSGNNAALQVNGVTATLNGTLSSATAGFAGRISFSNSTSKLILGGQNTWTGTLYLDGANGVILQVNDAGALPGDFGGNPGSVTLRANGGKGQLLFNAAGTYSQEIRDGGNTNGGGSATSHTALIGTTDAFTGLVTLDSTQQLTFKTASNGLELYAGNVGGTLEVKSLLTDEDVTLPLSKTGLGTVNLSRLTGNTYDGSTTVSAGTLLVNNTSGSATGTGAVSVAGGATLGGGGFISGSVTFADNAILAPGNSPGTLTVGGMTLANASVLNFQLDATNHTVGGGANDLVQVNGDLTLDGILNISVLNGASLSDGVYRLFNYTGNLTNNTLAQGTGFTAGYSVQVDTGSKQVNLVVIPEPATLGLLAVGGMMVFAPRRR